MILAIISPFTAVLAVSLVAFLVLVGFVATQLYYYNQSDQPAGMIGHIAWFTLTCLAMVAINLIAYQKVSQNNLTNYLVAIFVTMMGFFMMITPLEHLIYKINSHIERRKNHRHA